MSAASEDDNGSARPDESSRDDSSLMTAARQFAHYSTAGIMFPVSIAVGFFGGYFLDRWVGTMPLFAFVGLALGVAAAIRNLLRTVATDRDD